MNVARLIKLSLVALAAVAALCATDSASAREQALGAWQQYALATMTPDYEWAAKPSKASVRPDSLSRHLDAMRPNLTLSFSDSQGTLGLSVRRSYGAQPDGLRSNDEVGQWLVQAPLTLERTIVAPSLTSSLGERGSVSASVVFAYQQFASWGLGSVGVEQSPFGSGAPYAESSSGTGVQLQWRQGLTDVLGFTAGYRSKVDMQAFQSYQGVYADPGDFDLPAIASAGLDWSVSPTSRLGLNVARVMYSDVNTFTSYALPTRLLSLLGDGVAPAFEWRDLTVYSVDWSWQATSADALSLRYSTQQQPEPTSALLYDALADDFTDNNVALALTHQFRRMGSLRLAASYAPVSYFLGNASYQNRDERGDLLEVEAVWTVRF